MNRPLYGLMDVPFFGDLNPPTFALEEFLNNLTWRYRKAHAGLGPAWEKEQSPLGIAEYGRWPTISTAGRAARSMAPSSRESSSGMGGARTDASMEWLRAAREATFKEHNVISSYPAGLFKARGWPKEIYYDDVHLNPKGHKIYAEFLLGQLQSGAKLASWLGHAWGCAATPAHAPSKPAPDDGPSPR